jgi:acyl carrier protein
VDFQKIIFSIISDVSGFPLEQLSENKSLVELEINSIVFIQVVIRCENEFSIEFEDNQLLLTNFPTIKDLIAYIRMKYQEANP